MMAKTMILPAALRYQGEVAAAVNAVKAAGADNGAQMELLKSLTATISEFQKATARWITRWRTTPRATSCPRQAFPR